MAAADPLPFLSKTSVQQRKYCSLYQAYSISIIISRDASFLYPFFYAVPCRNRSQQITNGLHSAHSLGECIGFSSASQLVVGHAASLFFFTCKIQHSRMHCMHLRDQRILQPNRSTITIHCSPKDHQKQGLGHQITD